MNEHISFDPTNIDNARYIIDEYLATLAYPLDSYLEDIFLNADLFIIKIDQQASGFFAIQEDTIQFFHINKENYRDGADIFEKIVKNYKIKNVLVNSADPQINALIIEWDYQMERMGCWFSDSGVHINKANKIPNAVFRYADLTDIAMIKDISKDFFDEVSGGFDTLTQRIEAQTIFILEEDDKLYGLGIIEFGRLCTDYASIGMFANPQFRQLGAAKTILLNLKKIVYLADKQPIAGCWYYNTLSRKSMASAGMINTSLGYMAQLIKRDKPPLRTGNPPGEDVK
jgi:hypothetical protein